MASPESAPDPTLDDALAVFSQLDDPSTPLTATDVARELDCTRQTAYTKLTTLTEQDTLNTKTVGPGDRIWWRTQPHSRPHRTTDGIYDLDDAGRFPDVTERAEEIFQPSEEDGLGERGWEEVPDAAAFTSDDEPASQPVPIDITAQRERERQRSRHRDQLVALNQLNSVVQNITHAVVESSTWEEIQSQVCERLAAAGPYCHAWVGTIDRDDGVVHKRTAAGITGYHVDSTVSTDGTVHALSPTGAAAVTGELNVAQQLQTEPGAATWREHAIEHGVGSILAVPIKHEESLHGILTVCSERPNAFDPVETDRLVGLCRVVGHAFTAINRKRALITDEVIELHLRVRDLLDEIGVPLPDKGRIRIDGVVQTGEDAFLEQWSATRSAAETVEAMVEQAPRLQSVGFRTDDGVVTRFEVTATEPSVVYRIASIGGRIESAVIDGGDLDVVIHAPSGSDVRRLVEAVRSAYPGAHVVAYRQTIERTRATQPCAADLDETLTDRQRVVLETAFRSGYFKSPRDRTGSEIAESLGIAPSTFLQHIRASEQKLLGLLLKDGIE